MQRVENPSTANAPTNSERAGLTLDVVTGLFKAIFVSLACTPTLYGKLLNKSAVSAN